MATARNIVPPSRKLWSIVEMLKARHGYDDEKLGARANVTARTVRNDRANPDGIPLERVIRYIGIGLTGNELIKAIEHAIADKEDEIC